MTTIYIFDIDGKTLKEVKEEYGISDTDVLSFREYYDGTVYLDVIKDESDAHVHDYYDGTVYLGVIKDESDA